MIANYHTHTPRCKHASESEREFVEKAIELGFSELGFADHAPMPLPKGLHPTNYITIGEMRMALEETDGYVNTLLDLRKEYERDIKIHIGFETEYYSSCFDNFLSFISDYPIDYLILGQHFGEVETVPLTYYGAQTSSEERLAGYVDLVIKGIESDKITYVAHPDLLAYRGDINVYERQMSRLIRSANEHGVPLELNLFGLFELRHYPNLAFWQIASDIGCDVVFGTDAHSPDMLLKPTALKYAEKLVESSPKLNLLEKIQFKPVR